MRISDLIDLVWVSDPQLSPDGDHVAYVLNRIDESDNRYLRQIWVVATDGSSPPRALTSGQSNAAEPRWHPHGTCLAYTSTRPPDPAQGRPKPETGLHLLPFDRPGETVDLATGTEPFSEPTFSPDATMIAFGQRVPGEHYTHDKIADRPARKIDSLFSRMNGIGFVFDRPRHVHIAAVDGSAPVRDVTPGPWECSGPSWFADSRRIAIAAYRFDHPFKSDIAIVDIDRCDPDAEPALLTDATGNYYSPVAAPTGSSLVVKGHDDTGVDPQNAHLGLLDADASTPQSPRWASRAVDRGWDITVGASAPSFVADDQLVATYEDRGRVCLARVELGSGTIETLIDDDLSITGWSCGQTGGRTAIAYTATSATEPAELFVRIDGGATRLTHHSRRFVATVQARRPEHFLVGAGGGDDDGVDAWIITPHDFDPSGKYPMLLNIHGGPFTQYGHAFHDEFQMQARAGYVVVYANPRGSSGRADAWAQAILWPAHPVAPGSGWGAADFDDLMAVTDAALERFDFIDPDRVGVLGGSYGGYMTSWIVTHTDRFAAGCSERAVNNLLSLEHSSDIAGYFADQFGKPFVDGTDEYLARSPITHVKNLNTPLLILHSEDDLRCPDDQAWQLFHACQVLDKPDVEFWLFPGEDHELSRSGSPSHRTQRQQIITDFFDRHLHRQVPEQVVQ